MSNSTNNNPPKNKVAFPIGLVLGFGAGIIVGVILDKLALCMALGALVGIAYDSIKHTSKTEKK